MRSKSKGNEPYWNLKRKQQRWPVSYKWVAAGTIAIYTAIGSKTVNVAFAQDVPAPKTKQSSGQPLFPARQFSIPPGPMDLVITAFERTSEVRVLVPQAGIRDIQSPGVSGFYKPEQAMELLLKDTGVTYHFSGTRTMTIEITHAAAIIEVTDNVAPLAASSPKYAAPLRDIPQSIDVVPQSVMQTQNATTLRDALRNVAGISLAAGEGGSQGDNLTIRGFTARNDLFIDGMRDFGSYYRDPFNVQEVEVLQGPSSMTFGRGSTGGVVNQATKTPALSRFISGDLDIGTDLTRRVTLDINTPIPQLGDSTAFRLNIMGNEGNVAGRDQAENRRFGIAPSLEFGLGTPTRLTFSYFHQNGDDVPDYGLPWLLNGPAPVNRHNYYGFGQNFLRTYDDIGTIRAEHDFNSHFTLRNQTRYANYVRHAQITEPQLIGSVTAATPLSAITINRNQISVNSVESYFTDQLDLTANFKTGLIRHSVVAGVEAGCEISNPVRPKYTNVPTTSLLNPDEEQLFTGTAAPSTDVHTTANSAGAYVVDTMKIGRKLELTGGIRWDRFNTHYTQQITPAAAFNRLDSKPTWRAGAVYHPLPMGSVYVAASTSFNPSAEALSLSANNANLPPENNRNVEGGTKWDLAGSKLSIRGAIFRTDKMNAREPDPTNSLLNVLAGNQRVNGTEFTVNGHITNRWEILSSYAHIGAKVVSSKYYPAAVGAQLANVAANTFNFWSNYRLPMRWEVGVGGNFVDSRTASSTVPLDPVTGLIKKVPSYWVFNAMASHPISERVSIQANIYNIANRYYYDEPHPAHIVLGPGRSALMGLKFKF